ncbi:hypothetical protein EPUS_04532 [Endocarpon pusillum Z07020]|uniref:BTB domain-containing protein n=1 Tax=Endocarpon pusillum (strain Z07020 / HMAS-L-300199) TaxID=1263415 RepID=U1HFJ7_ENDPU|nr:uncharacterized protein EPUS_04532 [Endocarpon pusillum Z07020]ERF68880.1 hypothetical protein EPUS_04532 [Endocarpon pusillum Z07020]
MASILNAPHLGLSKFLETSEFSDFTIEATENVVKLEEQQPLLIARMIQYLYYGKYDVLNVAAGLTRILDKASSKVILDDAIFAQDFDFEVHADMYAMADRFEIPALKALSAKNFVYEVRSKNFSIADLVSAIDFVYNTTPENDFGLRKWVAYRAQQVEHELVRHEDFKTALKDHPDFAWDFATKYAKANYLWCSHCKDTIDLVECRCGFSGMCGDATCATGAPAALQCTRCKNWGKLQRELPPLKENLTLGELGRTDEPNAPIKRSPKKKRRLS